jgi:hypothetical protein
MPVAPSTEQATESGVDQDPTQQPAGIQVERSFETGSDEFFKFMSQLNAGNFKATYDAYQRLSLDGASSAQQLAQRASQNGLDHDQAMRGLSVQALQNAVETANMVGKQAVRHGDIAIENQWESPEEAAIAAIAAGVAKTVWQEMNGE